MPHSEAASSRAGKLRKHIKYIYFFLPVADMLFSLMCLTSWWYNWWEYGAQIDSMFVWRSSLSERSKRWEQGKVSTDSLYKHSSPLNICLGSLWSFSSRHTWVNRNPPWKGTRETKRPCFSADGVYSSSYQNRLPAWTVGNNGNISLH